MNLRTAAFLVFGTVAFSLAGSACARKTAHDKAADAVTDRYVYRYVRPLTNPVARLAHKGLPIPKELIEKARITMIEVIPEEGGSRIVFEDETKRPPNSGMITGLPNAYGVGLFFPADLAQSDVELRINYRCELGDGFVAIHVIAPNPLILKQNEE